MSSAQRRPGPLLPRSVAALAASSLLLAGAPLASAQDPVTPGVPVSPTVDPFVPRVLPTTLNDEYLGAPRDLTGCPYRITPPPAVDQSEVVPPGGTRPATPTVPETPVGGERLGGCEVVAPKGFAVPREVTASAWIVTDLDSGEVVAAKDAHGRYRPASTIKTLLALVVLDELPIDQLITVTDADLEGTEGSAVGVGPGGTYSVDRLLHGLLMMSGNDAAFVLAHRMGGVQATLDTMNAKAKALGCSDTHAASVNGLDKPGMSASAYDLALIFREAMTKEEFRKIVKTEAWGFPGYPAGDGAGPPDPANPPQDVPQPTTRPDGTVVNPGFVIYNDNKLLYNYPGALGGKTGFTDDARHTYIGAAERDGRRLAAVILDATRAPKAPWEQAAMLLDAGFAAKGAESVGTLVAPTSVPDDAERQGAGPLGGLFGGSGSDGQSDSGISTASGRSRASSAVAEYGPWVAVGAVALVMVAGVVVARRPRRR